MITAGELKAWVDRIAAHDPEAGIYVDEGGLTLQVWAADAYLEVGGEPAEVDPPSNPARRRGERDGSCQ